MGLVTLLLSALSSLLGPNCVVVTRQQYDEHLKMAGDYFSFKGPVKLDSLFNFAEQLNPLARTTERAASGEFDSPSDFASGKVETKGSNIINPSGNVDDPVDEDLAAFIEEYRSSLKCEEEEDEDEDEDDQVDDDDDGGFEDHDYPVAICCAIRAVQPAYDGYPRPLNIKTVQGEIFRVELHSISRSTVDHVMRAIERVKGSVYNQHRLMFRGKLLERGKTLDIFGICVEDTLQLLPANPTSLFYLENLESYLDPRFDYDLTNITHDTQPFSRGGKPYYRPLGSRRLGLKVLDKYQDNDWLGPDGLRGFSAAGEWPVAYHGTDQTGGIGIVRDGRCRLSKRKRWVFGHGIYTTPSFDVARDIYATSFPHEGKTWKWVLQCRVHPNIYTIPSVMTGYGAPYYLAKVEDHVRPYGICFMIVPNP